MRAAERGTPSVMVTFSPHPMSVLRPQAFVGRLTTDQQKEALAENAGIDWLVVVSFTAEVATTPAESFVRDFLVGGLAIKELLIGERFVFGRDRGGDLGLLRRMGAEMGFGVQGVKEVLSSGKAVSSSRIREALLEGRLEEVAELLGRNYTIEGTVVQGAGRGAEIGWPTINLRVQNDLLPPHGVYVSTVRLPGEEGELPSVTNVGTRPTLHRSPETVTETHILNLDRELYGVEVELSFQNRLRSEKRFAGVAELVEQITQDVESAREYFRTRSC